MANAGQEIMITQTPTNVVRSGSINQSAWLCGQDVEASTTGTLCHLLHPIPQTTQPGQAPRLMPLRRRPKTRPAPPSHLLRYGQSTTQKCVRANGRKVNSPRHIPSQKLNSIMHMPWDLSTSRRLSTCTNWKPREKKITSSVSAET